MSWADANLNDDPVELLARRITDLEDTVNTRLDEIRTEVGLATAAIAQSSVAGPQGNFFGGLEEQLANAVSVSLSAGLDAIRQSLTEIVAEAMTELAARLDAHASGRADLESVAAKLQHAVLLALSTFEQSTQAPLALAANDPGSAPATARDVARVNRRIDELRAMLLG